MGCLKLDILEKQYKLSSHIVDKKRTKVRNKRRYFIQTHFLGELTSRFSTKNARRYLVFGSTSYRAGRSETEVSLKRYKFCGKERDEETGLYYYGARYYAAWLGRFVSCDPMQFNQPDKSPYHYCSNNPVNRIDPMGTTDYYFKGKYIGSIGDKKNLIGIVDNKKLSKDIKSGTYNPGEASNGTKKDGLFVIDSNVLSEAVDVLSVAIEKGEKKEFSSTLKKDGDTYQVTARHEGAEIDLGKSKSATVTLASGDISIHSHPTGYTIIDGKSYFAKAIPSLFSQLGQESDESNFKNFEMNIIVGLSEGNSMVQKEDGSIGILGQPSYSINIYGKDVSEGALKKLSSNEARNIVKDYKQRLKNEN